MKRTTRSLALAILAVLFLPALARADDPAPAAAVPDEQAKAALDRFEKETDRVSPEAYEKALRELAKVPHPDVADRLLKELKHARDPAREAAALDGLAGQKPSAEKVGKVVERILLKESKQIADQFKRGDAGYLIDHRTGDPDVTSPEGKAALAKLKARDLMVASALRCLLALDVHEHVDADAVAPLLQSAEDELAVAALEAIERWELWPALPDVLLLYQMYPRENRWETGSAVDLSGSGSDATAKAKWMLYFGHPDKKKPRPKVVEALKKCVKDLADLELEDPADLKALLRRDDVKEKVSGHGRRH